MLTNRELADKNGWTPLQEAVESLRAAINFSPYDWAEHHRLAWIYGIVVGWEEGMDEVANKFGWDPETVARMEGYRRILDSA